MSRGGVVISPYRVHEHIFYHTNTNLELRVLVPTRYILYQGADNSLVRPTSRCILFDGENISFDASLV